MCARGLTACPTVASSNALPAVSELLFSTPRASSVRLPSSTMPHEPKEDAPSATGS